MSRSPWLRSRSSTRIRPGHIHYPDHRRAPLVLINNQSIDDPAIHSIYHDDAYGSHQIVQHLISLGHRQIAFLGNVRGGKTNAERINGYHQALLENKLKPDPSFVVEGPNGQPDGGVEGMLRILSLSPRPTAVTCYNDMMAVGAIQAVQNAGLRVPGDVSITGFDNIELAAYSSPPLTTFHQPKYELGWEAAQLMLRVLAESDMMNSPRPEIIMIRGHLIVRQSTILPAAEIRVPAV